MDFFEEHAVVKNLPFFLNFHGDLTSDIYLNGEVTSKSQITSYL